MLGIAIGEVTGNLVPEMADEVGMILRIYPYFPSMPRPRWRVTEAYRAPTGRWVRSFFGLVPLPPRVLIGLVPLPPRVLVGLAVIAASYVMVSEWTKRRFFAHAERSNLPGG